MAQPPSARAHPDAVLADRAESVRAYLVAVRGGAPFLSSADGRLLLSWLEQGVPVPLIQSAIDDAAERRAKKRLRSRLTLRSCRKQVEARWGAGPAPPPQAEVGPLQAWLEEVAVGGPSVAAFVSAAGARIEEGGDIEALVGDLAEACRRFHEASWRALPPSAQDQHRAAAALDLDALRDHVKPAVWTELVEEAARGRVRRQWPLVCASAVWDRVAAG